MERLHTLAHGISRVGAIAGGMLLLLAAIVIFVDITMRYTMARTLGGADELAGYALAIASAWGFSAALLSRSHIRIDTVYVRVRRGMRAALDIASLAALAFFFTLVAWHAYGVVRQSWVSQSRSQSELETLLIIPQGLWFAGLVFFVAVAALLLVRSFAAVASRNFDKLFALIGSKSAVAEAEEEIASIEKAFEDERKDGAAKDGAAKS